ncbi:tetratricopeptide repeat protein [Henriciella sp. AS95]|uniref:tetratricopeptide repeat protein n=1 Tax=Henriciella sp. AS95 TaxID=3135782 RepID=UPI003173B2C6
MIEIPTTVMNIAAISIPFVSDWLKDASAFDIATLIGTGIAIIQFVVWVAGAEARRREKAETVARAERAEAERDALKRQVDALMEQSTEQTGLVRDMHEKLDRQFKAYVARAEAGSASGSGPADKEDIAKAKAAVFDIASTGETFEQAIEIALQGDESGFYTLIREAEKRNDIDLWIRIAHVARLNAPRIAMRALEEARKMDPSDPGIRYELARVYGNIGRTEEAKALFTDLLAASETTREQRAHVLLELGYIAEHQHNIDEARDFVERARSLFHEFKDPISELDCVALLAEFARLQGQPSLAETHYRAARAIVSGLSDPEQKIDGRDILAIVCESLGKQTEAESHHRNALQLSREIGNTRSEADQLESFSRFLLSNKNYLQAIRNGRAALKLHTEIGNKVALPRLHEVVGAAYAGRGEPDQAREHYARALALSEDFGQLSLSADVLNGLGLLDEKAGDLDSAAMNFEKSLSLCQDTSDRKGQSLLLENLRRVFDKLGQKERACEFGLRKLKLDRELGLETSSLETWLREKGCLN